MGDWEFSIKLTRQLRQRATLQHGSKGDQLSPVNFSTFLTIGRPRVYSYVDFVNLGKEHGKLFSLLYI